MLEVRCEIASQPTEPAAPQECEEVTPAYRHDGDFRSDTRGGDRVAHKSTNKTADGNEDRRANRPAAKWPPTGNVREHMRDKAAGERHGTLEDRQEEDEERHERRDSNSAPADLSKSRWCCRGACSVVLRRRNRRAHAFAHLRTARLSHVPQSKLRLDHSAREPRPDACLSAGFPPVRMMGAEGFVAPIYVRTPESRHPREIIRSREGFSAPSRWRRPKQIHLTLLPAGAHDAGVRRRTPVDVSPWLFAVPTTRTLTLIASAPSIAALAPPS